MTPKKREVFHNMGIDSVEDLLTHYPFRYEENVEKPYHEWVKGDKVFFEGTIISIARVIRYGRRKSVTKFKVLYDGEELEISLYNRPWTTAFKLDIKISIQGKFDGNYKVMASNYQTSDIDSQRGIVPVYNVKDGMSQKDVRKYIANALQSSIQEDFVPEEYIGTYRLLHKQQALQEIHFPKDKEQLKESVRTLKYEEFLKFQLMMQYYKSINTEILKMPKQFDMNKIQKVIANLAFTLTNDQQKALDDIFKDMTSTHIMYRLIQGDVGCGKTMVATLAMYACCLSGQQAAFLAPTEILAKQHYANVVKTLKGLGLRIEVLYSSINAKEKEAIYGRLQAHEIDIIIGTHAIFQEKVIYADLGLVIADEQHRFGVKQRRQLVEKGEQVDFLLMSATPIPRTLATSLFGDMDVSTIEELPKGRKEIITTLVKENSMRSILKEVLAYIDEGNQCYIVCPAIEKNDEFVMRNVDELYHNLKESLPKKYRLQYLHGKMSTEEKDEIMESFLEKRSDILISTSVIEVGMDVKDANIMIIYDAHRFGLSQIHQLRGRVGRGNHQGYCYLLSGSKDPDSLKRLEVLVKTNDGFEISRQDLLLRGPGDLLGKRQSGVPGFILGDLVFDQNILDVAKQDAQKILHNIHEYPNIETYIHEKELTSYID